jgi:VWFA-related protein
MRVKITGTFPKSALAIVLAGCLCGLVLFSSARAQQGAAGQNPPVYHHSDQPDTTKPPEQPTQVRVQANLVTAPVTVTNSKGDFVDDLQEKDFEVLDNDVRQHIEQFSLEQRVLDVVIVVQANSISAPLLDEVRPLGPVFSGLMLGPQGAAAVIAYSDRVRVLQDLTPDSDKVESVLRGIEASGAGTAHLNDALARAVEILEHQPKENRRIIVAFSDGHDLGSETHKEELVQRAVNADITIYGLGFSPSHALLSRQAKAPEMTPMDASGARPVGPGMVPTASMEMNTYDVPTLPVVPILLDTGEMVRSIIAKSAMQFYAGYTGGVFYEHWSKKSVQDELGRIADEIHSQYEIAYVPHAPSQNGFHRIEVHVDRSNVRVRTRAGYFMGGTNP